MVFFFVLDLVSGSAEAIATIEHILDHIATVLNKDPVDVRAANFSDDYKEQLVAMITQLKETSDFDNRKQQIKEFNEVTLRVNLLYFHSVLNTCQQKSKHTLAYLEFSEP